MATVNRSEVLELLAAGKISAAEAAELLSRARSEPAAAAEEPAVAEAPAKAVEPADVVGPEATSGKTPSWFHVRVRDLESGRNKVTVNIPLRMFKFGMKIGRRFSPELAELDWDEIENMVTNMESGVLVEVQDEEDKEQVQIYVD
ncbi:MAG TPA: hypothetical protein VF177_16075 [Anaerolineae bacterium]